MTLTRETQKRIADTLANDNRRIEHDVWSGPAKMLGYVLLAFVWAVVFGLLAYLYHSDWFWELI